MNARYFVTLPSILLFGLLSMANADHHLEGIDLAGVWHVKAENDEGARELRWTFEADGDRFKGASEDLSSGNERKFDRVKVKQKAVTVEMDIERDGQVGVIIVKAEESSAGKMAGRWSIENDEGDEFMSGKLSAWKEVEFSGKWDAVAELSDGNRLESVVSLEGKNSNLKGVLTGESGEIEIDTAQVERRSVRLEFDFEMNGNDIDCIIEAEADGNNKLVGKWRIPDLDGQEVSGKWTAARKGADIAGQWNVTAVVPGADEYKGTLSLVKRGDKYSGSSKSSNGDTSELDSLAFDGKQLKYSVPFEQDGFVGTISVEAELQKDGSLRGEWIAKDQDGQEVARDSWTAKR